MVAHNCVGFRPGCFRCELGKDELIDVLGDEVTELQAVVDHLQELIDVFAATLTSELDDDGSAYMAAFAAVVAAATPKEMP